MFGQSSLLTLLVMLHIRTLSSVLDHDYVRSIKSEVKGIVLVKRNALYVSGNGPYRGRLATVLTQLYALYQLLYVNGNISASSQWGQRCWGSSRRLGRHGTTLIVFDCRHYLHECCRNCSVPCVASAIRHSSSRHQRLPYNRILHWSERAAYETTIWCEHASPWCLQFCDESSRTQRPHHRLY